MSKVLSTLALLLALLLLLFMVVALSTAQAHEHQRKDLESWYGTLQSKKGPCCGGPNEDATALSDLQWRTKGDGYEVFVEGAWIDVPEDTVVHERNLAGGARVWLYHFGGAPVVRCFLPGTLS